MEETPSIVKDPEAALCLKVTYESLLEPGDGNGSVRDARELEAAVLSVEVLVETNLHAADGCVVGQLGREVGVAEE